MSGRNKIKWMNLVLRLPVVMLLCIALLAETAIFCIGAFAVEAETDAGADVSLISAGDHIYMGKRGTPGYTGLPYWRVLDRDPDDGSLYLMSEYLWTGNSTDDFIQFNEIDEEGVPMEGYEDLGYKSKGSAWQGSMAQSWCRGFEEAVLSDVNGLTIKEITKTDGEFTSPDDKDVTFARVRNILENDRVFFLSAEEAVHYMPSKEERFSYLHDGSSIGERCDYWLRSPRLYTFSECVGKVLAYGNEKGAVARQVVSSLGAVRPVFWAKLSSDTRITKCVHDGQTVWTVDPQEEAEGYRDISYVWSADNSSCTASAVCQKCGKTIRETVQASSAVTIPATILEDGIRTYTATFHGEMFMTQEKKVSIPKTYDHLAGVQDNRLPKAAVKRAAGKRKKTITVTWKKLSKSKKKKVSGIEVQYAQDSKFRNNAVIKKAGKSKTSMTLKKLKSKKKYWVRIRTYKIKGGIKYVSRWSRARAVRVK